MPSKSNKSTPVSWRTLMRRANNPNTSPEVATSLREQAAGLRRGTRGTPKKKAKKAKAKKLKRATPVSRAVSKPKRDGDGRLSPQDQQHLGEFLAAIEILRPAHVNDEAVVVPWSQIEALVSAIVKLRSVS